MRLKDNTDSEAVQFLRKYVTDTHEEYYKILLRDVETWDAWDRTYAEYYSPKHWKEADMQALCVEAHQICWDTGDFGESKLTFVYELVKKRGWRVVLETFKCTKEHSH